MVVPFLVVENGPPLDRFFRDGEIDVHATVARGGRLDGELEGVQQRPGVAVGDVDEMGEGIVIDGQAVEAPVSARVGKGIAGDRLQVALGQRFELEQAAAGDQRPVDGEVGVFGGGADQDDGAVLDPGQERVLLGLVEAVDLVDEEDGALAVQVAALLGLVDRLPDVGDPGEHGVDGDEMGTRRVGDDVGEGGLAGSRRAVEDEGGELVGLDGAAQQPSGPEDVLLADEVVERRGPQARRQRLLPLELVAAARGEQVEVGGAPSGSLFRHGFRHRAKAVPYSRRR